VGGALLGLALGYFVSTLTKRIDDAQVEITFTTILAYGTFLLARHLHLSAVFATVAAGLVIGNFAVKTGMSARTLTALRSFWEYASFIIHSQVFLLIGLEVRLGGVLRAWKPILIAIAAIFVGRILSVYTLVPFSNLFSKRIAFVWQHVLVWAGLRGALSLALALSLDSAFPYREQILNLTFGVVVFSILVQGLSIKPVVGLLGLAPGGLA
jgi:CPA1 family monovalent cation:H+ antiporter